MENYHHSDFLVKLDTSLKYMPYYGDWLTIKQLYTLLSRKHYNFWKKHEDKIYQVVKEYKNTLEIDSCFEKDNVNYLLADQKYINYRIKAKLYSSRNSNKFFILLLKSIKYPQRLEIEFEQVGGACGSIRKFKEVFDMLK